MDISALIPRNYDAWKHCITVECRQPLTPAFIQQRLVVWRDSNCEESRRFRRLYGDEHLQRLIGWLERAESEIR